MTRILFRNKRSPASAADGLPGAYPETEILAPPRPRAFAVSCLLHGLLILSAVILARALSEEDGNWFQAPVSVQYLNLRAPDKAGIQYISGPITTHFESLPVRTAAGQREEPRILSAPQPAGSQRMLSEANPVRPLAQSAEAGPSGGASDLENRIPAQRADNDQQTKIAKTPAATFAGALTGIPLDAESLGALPIRPANAVLDLFALSLLRSSASSPKEFQIIHPENGQYDVVLVHSGLPAELPEDNPLKGDPIYTVYLDVGMNKSWVLHYSSVDPTVYISEHVVRIGGGQKITPPYPRVTVVPTQAAPIKLNRQITVHGSIDAQGCFRELRPLSDLDQSSCAQLEPLLQRWHFRPATQGGSAVPVDIVMVIPPVQ